MGRRPWSSASRIIAAASAAGYRGIPTGPVAASSGDRPGVGRSDRGGRRSAAHRSAPRGGMSMMCEVRKLAAVALGLCCTAAAADNATVPGVVTTPHPTILNLAIEWQIDGDDNLDGVVSVRYRAEGEDTWHDAMPLRRVPAGQSRGTRPIFHWGNKHSGSIFDLRPDTRYEIALTLRDPDGGSADEVVRARTRQVPRAGADAHVRQVAKDEIGSARPGEVLVLAAGDYGEWVVPRDGEPDRPIVYRSPDGSAVFSSIS